VTIEGNKVAVMFIDTEAEFPGLSYQIFLINTESWATQILHPKFREPITRLSFKLTDNRITLVGATAETIILREVALPECVVSTIERFQYKPTSAEEKQFIEDLGFLTQHAISSCPNPIVSDTLILHSTTAPDILSLLFFDFLDQVPGHGHLVRLFFGRGADDHNGSEAVEGKGVSNTRMRQDLPFPFSAETSVKLVRIGTTGRRAVWIEDNWETDESRLMRSYFPSDNLTAATVGALIPPVPVNPVLPFSPRECQSLAFSEVSGRLCCGTYNGVVWLLDYN